MSESKTEEGVQVLRGFAVLGGTLEYKVKITNNTKYVITDVSVTIVSYPKECMELQEGKTRKLPRIEPAGFRSLQFILEPTHDHVEGQIVVSVSYMDHENELQVMRVEPYVIRSVCDLLEPLESTLEEFETMLFDMAANVEEITLDKSPHVTFSNVMALLPERNFEIISTKSDSERDEFRGTVLGLGQGKYTRKKVALRVIVSGAVGSKISTVVVEALGDDVAMLPRTIEEIVEGISRLIEHY